MSAASAALPAERASASRRALRLEQLTIGYNILEGIIAVAAGLAAGSLALAGFGFDSGIEVAAAVVVLTRLRAEIRGDEVDERKERRALRFVAVTFFVLAAYILVEGVRDLVTSATPDVSPVGIVVTALSCIVMPWLAAAKLRVGREMGSRLVIADAAETRLCAWLSVSTFAGLAGFAAFGWTWLDPVAGFVIAIFAVSEGREAWEGELVCDDHCSDTGCSEGKDVN